MTSLENVGQSDEPLGTEHILSALRSLPVNTGQQFVADTTKTAELVGLMTIYIMMCNIVFVIHRNTHNLFL